jgi:hydrogenase expression/formation protein HypD
MIMKYVDEFRDAGAAQTLVARITSVATRRWVLMEVCGGQTHGLLRNGIPAALKNSVDLIHGPGCPVCVTSERAIDFALRLAVQPDVVVASFGDMLRVPGTTESLLTVRSRGGNVRTVYSPVDAVKFASKHPDRQVVFFAVGFETTTPATALAVLQARELGLKNFTLLTSHVRVQPAMESIMMSTDNRVQAFLAAGHVCVVNGFESYHEFARRFRVPVAVTGFEPLDLLQGIFECVKQLESGLFEVANCYERAASRVGNETAQAIVRSVYEVADKDWRGLGVVPSGGLQLRPEFSDMDAYRRFSGLYDQADSGGNSVPSASSERCRAGEVLSGQLRPCDCPEFAAACTPDSPLGAPMVSSEGACAAYFRYARVASAASVSVQTEQGQ